MRTQIGTRLFAVAALVLPLGAAAGAQTLTQAPAAPPITTPAPQAGSFDFGGRLFSVSGDESRVQRFRDLRGGPFLENFRYSRDKQSWVFNAQFDHIGYRDQRYAADFTRFGAITASFQWDQIPLFYSVDTRTPYTEESPGVLRLPDAAQQVGALSAVTPLARQFDLRARRDTARFALLATPRRDLDLTVNFSSYSRNGEMPWSGSFGFGNTTVLPAPLDHRTTDLNAAAEWGSDRGSLRLQYDGSWFNNNVQTLVWDNPLRAADSPTAGSAQGRTALWPSSTLNAVSVTGTAALPARSRATAYLSMGAWNQNEDLLPFTINSAIAPIPLSRTTADAQAAVTAMNFSYTSRPVNRLWFSTRFRRYDFDNQTPDFHFTNLVAYDQTLQAFPFGSTEPFGYIRNWFDADASYELTSFAALRVGYGLEDVERTFRLFEETAEHTFRTSIDSTGNHMVSVRGVYEHAVRNGRGLDEEVLDDIGEQVSLRQFDISDRNRDRVSAIVQVTPMDTLGFNGTIGLGRDERPDAYFGLRHANTRFFSVGTDLVPNDMVSAGLTYGFDRYTTLQRSRQANPGVQFDDPTRDWETDALDRVHYISANAGLKEPFPRTTIDLGYDFNRSHSRYLYLLLPGSALPAPQQLPPVLNELHRATVDVKYALARNISAGVAYWLDKYTVDDFALGTDTLTRLDMPSALLLGYVWRPYTANTVWARLTYFW